MSTRFHDPLNGAAAAYEKEGRGQTDDGTEGGGECPGRPKKVVKCSPFLRLKRKNGAGRSSSSWVIRTNWLVFAK